MGTEIQTVKNQMTLKNWAEEVAECQSSGMTVSAWTAFPTEICFDFGTMWASFPTKYREEIRLLNKRLY